MARSPAPLKKEPHPHGIFWTGSAAQLIDAGLCALHQFPGQPGVRKTRHTIAKDGNRAVFHIMRVGKTRFQVYKSNEYLLAEDSAAREFVAGLVGDAGPPRAQENSAPAAAGGRDMPFSPQQWARMEFGEQCLLFTAIKQARELYAQELDRGHSDPQAGVNAWRRLGRSPGWEEA